MGFGAILKSLTSFLYPSIDIAEVNFELILGEERFHPNLTDHTSKRFLDLQARITSSVSIILISRRSNKIPLRALCFPLFGG